MEYRMLGQSGLEVSRLCFGSLTMGPLQANLSSQEGAGLLERAFQGGVNFVDTAELYGTYDHLAAVFRHYKDTKNIIIATKTYAYTKEQAAMSLQKALKDLKRDYIDIFLLHEQESKLTLEGHREALDYLFAEKKKGTIRAVGISCHTIAAVRAALSFKEIEIIHPIFNINGLGIKDGTLEEMSDVLQRANEKGIGIYSMKPLGGGHLQNNALEALSFVRNISFVDSIALGLRSSDEIDFALHFFNNEEIPLKVREAIKEKIRMLSFISEDCLECLKCVSSCPQNALSWKDHQPLVDNEKCIWCGYCGAACPAFCLRIV